MRNHDRPTTRSAAGTTGFPRYDVNRGTDAGARDGGIPPVKRVFRTLRRHWGKSTLFVIAILGLTALTLVAAPRSYVSQSKLFVRVGRESVGLDPTATTGQTLMLTREHEFELNSIAELLESRLLVEQVVDEIGPERILDPKSGDESAPATKAGGFLVESRQLLSSLLGKAVGYIRDLDPISDRDRAIHQLSKDIEIVVPKRSSVVQITCSAETPELAHDVVEALVTAYMDEHIRVNQTAGSYAFFDEQTEVLRQELETASEQLCQAKNQSGMLSIENQQAMLHEQLARNFGERLRVEAALAAADQKIANIAAAMKSINPQIPTDQVTGLDNAAADRMREKLYELELRKAELATQFTSEHPLVVAIEKQLADAHAIFNQQPESRTHATLTVNANHQALELSLLTERALAASLRGELSVLQSQQADLDQRREALNRDEMQLKELQRQVDVLAAGYTVHMQSREQGRVNEALEQQRISNVNIAQPATFVAKPDSPNKLIVLLVGLLFAFAGGLTLPFCFEGFEGLGDSGMRPNLVTDTHPAERKREHVPAPVSADANPPAVRELVHS